MRFYKVLCNTSTSAFKHNTINEGEIVCFSFYFKGVVVISDGKQKTRHLYSTDRYKLNLILSDKVTPLTEKELNKIRPHLKKEHFNKDL